LIFLEHTLQTNDKANARLSAAVISVTNSCVQFGAEACNPVHGISDDLILGAMFHPDA
jgi:hypothetical protein